MITTERSMSIKLCEGGSLMFSVIGNALYLKGGMVYRGDQVYMDMPEVSYKVLEYIGLDQFEDMKKYYFYLSHSDIVDRFQFKCVNKPIELEKDIFFLISIENIEGAVLLAQLEVDYLEASINKIKTISVPKNIFKISKNELSTECSPRVYFKKNFMFQADRERISKMLMHLSREFYRVALLKNVPGFNLPSSLFFQFAQKIKSFLYTPKILYFELIDYTKMLCWIDINGRAENIISSMREEILGNEKNLRTHYCIFDFENEDSFFYQVFNYFDSLSNELSIVLSEITHDVLEKTADSQHNELSNSVVPNIIIPDPEEDENTHTVIIDRNELCLQVGRGTQNGNDIILGESDKTVSRVHLNIYPHKNGAFIEDLSSMGTYVDGERLEKGIKKFVTISSKIKLGRKGCTLDLSDFKIQKFLDKNK